MLDELIYMDWMITSVAVKSYHIISPLRNMANGEMIVMFQYTHMYKCNFIFIQDLELFGDVYVHFDTSITLS